MKQYILGLALVLWGQSAATESQLIGRFSWHLNDPDFGGFSAIHVAPDGINFHAVTDRGHAMTGQLVREGGVITAVTSTPLVPLQRMTGADYDDWTTDPEGIAVNRDGTIFIALEGPGRIWSYDTFNAAPTLLPRHPHFARMQPNSALESLAIDKAGALYTLPERSGRANRPFPVYRFQNGAWDIPFTIPRRNAHLIVGADIGPDNRLYLLERDFTGAGFRTRVRRFSLDGTDEQTLLDTGTGTNGNLEGISVWEDEIGLRMTLIVDDNFRFFQQTEIVEYRIAEKPAGSVP